MKIINEKGNFKLQYKYKIITNRHNSENGIYYYYTTQLSCEIVNYFGTYDYWVYKKGDNIYLTTENISSLDVESKKLTARSKYNTSKIRVIPLNPKIFNLIGDVTDKYLQITLVLNEKDTFSDDILVELKII